MVGKSALANIALCSRALRLYQWAKNFLVFVPAILAGQLDVATLLRDLAGFLSIGFTASGLYIVNDLIDLSADREHPLKRHRPLASGAMSRAEALGLAGLSLVVGLGFAAGLGPLAVFVGLIYGASSLSYSLYVKRLLVADVLTLALLYSLRLYAGGVYARVAISDWLIVFSVFFFLGLALMKRLIDLPGRASQPLERPESYRQEDKGLVETLGVTSSMTSFAILALYVNSERGQLIYPRHEFLWGVWIVVFYCVSRLWFSVWRGEVREDPVDYVLRTLYCQLSLVLAALLIWYARVG